MVACSWASSQSSVSRRTTQARSSADPANRRSEVHFHQHLARPFIERLLEDDTLVALGERFVEFERAYYGVLTAKGRRKPLARRCLTFFELD